MIPKVLDNNQQYYLRSQELILIHFVNITTNNDTIYLHHQCYIPTHILVPFV